MAASALYNAHMFLLPPLSHKTRKPFHSLCFNPPPSISIPRSKFYGATVAATKLPRRIFRGHGLVADDSGIAPEPESPYSEAGAGIDLNLPRRSLLVQFTCNLCGERTKRLVNRLAYERGAVFVQTLTLSLSNLCTPIQPPLSLSNTKRICWWFEDGDMVVVETCDGVRAADLRERGSHAPLRTYVHERPEDGGLIVLMVVFGGGFDGGLVGLMVAVIGGGPRVGFRLGDGAGVVSDSAVESGAGAGTSITGAGAGAGTSITGAGAGVGVGGGGTGDGVGAGFVGAGAGVAFAGAGAGGVLAGVGAIFGGGNGGGEATGGGGGDVGGETGEGFGCCGGGAFGLETGGDSATVGGCVTAGGVPEDNGDVAVGVVGGKVCICFSHFIRRRFLFIFLSSACSSSSVYTHVTVVHSCSGSCSCSSHPVVVVPVPVFFRRSLLPLVVVPILFRSLGNRLPEVPVEEGVADVEGFPSGPYDTSVLSDFENHIALRVWNGEERPELKLSSHGRKMAKFRRLALEIEGLVVASGLSPLIACFLDTGDRGLIGIPHLEQLHVDDAVQMLVELLECWIYEHFPLVASVVIAEDYDERRPRACHWTSDKALPVSMYWRRLDRLTLYAVCWILYSDHRSFREFEVISLFFVHLRWGPLMVIHQPERVVRQFGYIQTIPPHPFVSSLFAVEIDDRWMQFGDYIAPVGKLCAVPGHCLLDYLD
ncbi:hypothetical protein HKD37_01G001172 [Glycine soja]